MKNELVLTISVIIGFAVPMIYYLWRGWQLREGSNTLDGFFFLRDQLKGEAVLRTFVSTWMSVGNVIAGVIVLAMLFGPANIWLIVTWGFGFWILSRHAGAIKKGCSGNLTLHGFIGREFDSRLIKYLASGATIVACIGVFSLELMVGAALISAIPGIAYATEIVLVFTALFVGVIVLYTSLGGFYAVTQTDTSQYLFICFAIAALTAIALGFAFWLPGSNGWVWSIYNLAEPMSLADQFGFPGWEFWVGFFFFQVFLLPGDMGSWQRINAAQSVEVSRKGLVGVGIQTMVLWVFLVMIGILLAGAPEGLIGWVDPANPVPTQGEPLTSTIQVLLHSTSTFQTIVFTVLTIVAIVGLVAAMMSTADSYLLVVMMTFTTDLVYQSDPDRPADSGEPLDEDAIVRNAKTWLLGAAALGLLAYWFFTALTSLQLVALVFIVFAIQCALTPIAVHALREDLEKKSNYAGVVVLALIISAASIGYLGYLEASNTDPNLAYKAAYKAPIAAVCVPTVLLFFATWYYEKSLGKAFKLIPFFFLGR